MGGAEVTRGRILVSRKGGKGASGDNVDGCSGGLMKTSACNSTYYRAKEVWISVSYR